ncbi:MAG: hypothetical protein ACR2OY_00955 [Boseongicola sp.]
MKKTILIVTTLAALTGCASERGVGLGTVGAGGDGTTAPQSTRTEFEMTGVEPLPIYRFSTNGKATPADALNAGGNRLREEGANIQVTAESRTYYMRQVVLDANNYVVSEGAAPVASLTSVIRARTGCLVNPQPLRSKDAAVYTLDCS